MVGATLAWVITVALVGFFRVNRVSERRSFTRSEMRRAVEVTLVLDAYLNLFVLPFAAEMFLVPFLVFLGTLVAFAQYAPQLQSSEYDSTRSCLQWLLNLIGLAIIVYATMRLVQTLTQGKFGDLERGFVLPLWLNLALIPCTLLIEGWAAYHDAFIRLQIGADPTPQALRRAKRALILEVRFHVYTLGKFGPPWPYRFSTAETAADARSVARALVAEREVEPRMPEAREIR